MSLSTHTNREIYRDLSVRIDSHLTFSVALAMPRPAELAATQRYWPWFPGLALANVSTAPSGPILALSTREVEFCLVRGI